MKLTTYTAVFTAIMATTAAAQSFPPSGYVRGVIAAEHFDIGSNDESGLYGDVTVGAGGLDIGSPWPFGLELGAEVLAIEGDSEHVFYPVVFFDAGAARYSIGMPRDVVVDMVHHDPFGTSFFINRVLLSEGTSTLTRFARFLEGEDAYGLRYDRSLGATQIGVSLHDFPDADLQSALAAVSHDTGMFTVAAGIEYVEGSGSSDTGFYGSLSYENGPLAAALYGSRPVGNNQTFVQVGLDYMPIQNLTVGADFFTVSGSSTDGYAVSAEYSFLENAFIGASYMDIGSSSNDGFSVTAGWNLNY